MLIYKKNISSKQVRKLRKNYPETDMANNEDACGESEETEPLKTSKSNENNCIGKEFNGKLVKLNFNRDVDTNKKRVYKSKLLKENPGILVADTKQSVTKKWTLNFAT